MSTSITKSVTTNEEPVLKWQVHLAKEEPKKLAVVIIVSAVMSVFAFYWYNGSMLPVIVILFAVLGSLSDFLMPVTFTITGTHVSASTKVGKRMMAWADVKRVYLDEYGVKLSPLRRLSRLEAYRGVYLRFSDNRDEVLDVVKRLRPNKDV